MRLSDSLRASIVLACAALLLLIIDIDAANPVKDEHEDSPGRQLLAGPDFRVSTRVLLTAGNIFLLQDEYMTEEFFSNSQRRALVELHRTNDVSQEQQLHSVYHYHKGQVIVNDMFGRPKCGPITAEQMATDLLGKMEVSCPKDWFKERVEVPDYVVGLARLLFIIDYHRKSLLESDETHADTSLIHNHEAITYMVPESKLGEIGLNGKLWISYHASEKHQYDFDLPLQIKFKDKYSSMWIHFSFIGPVDQDLADQEDRLYPLSRFAFPIGIGCSDKMEPASKSGWKTVPTEVVSFQAQIYKHNKLQTKETSISKRFVAFDSYAGAMRSDAITPNSYSITIIDFWNKKKFNILAGDQSYDEKISQKQCVASRVADLEQYKAFLPFKEFIFMGQAVIRGVDCYVFEHTSDKLPPVIFPLLTYTNMNGKEEAIFGRDPQTFTLVYYFAISLDEKRRKLAVQNVPSGPLMRIDAYNKKVLAYHIDVFDYVNQLVAAPNGDRQEELFALKDRCSSGQLGSDAYATLVMELVYKPTSAKPRTPQEVVEIIQSQHLRNKATLRALARGSTGVITRLSDIETQLRVVGADQLKLFVEAQLNVADIEVTEVRQVGRSATDGVPTIVKTIEECFQWAAHAQSGSDPILFVSCANSCNVDTSPSVEYEKDDKTIKSISSNIYKPDPKRNSSRSCPAMLVETKSRPQQNEAKLAALRTTFNWIRSDFDGKIVRLLMPNEGVFDLSLADLIFEVTKVDINNDRWSVALGYEKAHLNDDDPLFKLPGRGYSESISGLGLSETIGQVQQPRQKDSSPDEEPIMSYHICHSICMSNMNCRSFSICVTRRGIECIISGVNFRDRTLLKEIEEKLSSDRQQSNDDGSGSLIKTGTISVANPKRAENVTDGGDGDDEDSASSYEQIVLKVDFRCKLYKKNVLEMFHKLRPNNVALKNSAMTPVGSQEECAEICLRNNMVFFKKTAKTKLELLQNNDEELDDEELIKRIRDEYNDNLMTWCSTFHFLSTSSSHLDEQMKDLIDGEKLKAAGLCVIARSPNAKKGGSDKKKKKKNDSDSKSADKPLPRVPFESFQFLYSNLYDVQYGIRLEPAEIDDKGKPLPMINKSLREYAPDAESCAQRCFLQTSELKPICRSFDFIEMRVRDSDSKYARTYARRYCEFHTLSLAEIRLNGLVEFMVVDLSSEGAKDDPNGTIVHAWHYESRESYTLEDAVLSKLVLVKGEANLLDHLQAYRLQALGIMTILLVAFVLSAAIVILHGDKIANKFKVARRDSISDPPRSFLSSLVSGGPSQSSNSIGSTIRHKRFVAGDQDLPDIPELNTI